MEQTRGRGTDLSKVFLFLILIILPVIVQPKLGGAAQFAAARAAALAWLVSIPALLFVLFPPRGARLPNVFLPALMLVFIAWTAITGYAAHPKWGEPHGWLRFAVLFMLYAMAGAAADRNGVRRVAEIAVLTSGAAVALYGLADFAGIAHVAHHIDWGGRSASLFEDPNYFGIYLLFPLYWSLSGALTGIGRARVLRFCVAAVCAAGLIVSGSRSAWMSFVAALPFFAAALMVHAGPKKRMQAIIPLAIFLIFLSVAGAFAGRLPRSEKIRFDPLNRVVGSADFLATEAQGRLNLHRVALRMMREHPVAGGGDFGVTAQRIQAEMGGGRGLSIMDIRRQPEHAYNDYLTIGARFGIPAMVMYVLLILAASYCCWKFVARERGAGGMSLAPGCFAAAAAFAVAGAAFQSPLSCIPAAAAFWANAGIAAPEPENADSSITLKTRIVLAALILPAAVMLVIFHGIALPLGEYHYNTALAYRSRADFSPGLGHAETAVKLRPRDARSWIVKGDHELRTLRTGPALESYNRALELRPYDSQLHLTLGLYYMFIRDWRRAEDSFSEAIRWCATPHPHLLPYLAAAMSGAGDTAGAVALLEQGVIDYPDDGFLFSALAGAYLASGRSGDALAAAERSVKLAPGQPAVAVRYAETLIASGRLQDARRELFGVLEVDPGNARARALFGRIPPPFPGSE